MQTADSVGELQKIVGTIPDKLLKPAIRKACRAAIKPVQLRLKAELPRKTGTLRRSVKIRSIPRSRVKIGVRIRIQIPREKRGKKGYGYHVAQEFGWKIKTRYGSRKVPGTHQMEKTADVMRPQVAGTFANSLSTEVNTSAKGF